VGHASRSNDLLCVKVSRASVSQSGLKTGGCATVDGARDTIVEIALSQSRRRTGQCNGLRQTLLP
jgi:hypothetical protein